MRILFLNPIANIGGGERVLLTAIAGIRRQWPEAVVGLITLGEGPLLDAAAKLGTIVQHVKSPVAFTSLGESLSGGRSRWRKVTLALRAFPASLATWKTLSALRTAIRQFAPDLVHSNGIKTHLLSRFAVPREVTLVWHLHDFCSHRPASARLLRRLAGRVRAAVAISEAVAADAAKLLPATPIKTVLNAVDLNRFAPGPADGADLDRRAGLPPADADVLRVGLIATYARWKGHVLLLDAAARLAATSPELRIRWFIVGGPIYHTAAQFSRAELQSAVVERQLTDCVGFIGFIDETPAIYRSLDVVVHASTQPEPFGLTIVEAMACGRPVVVSAAGGAQELFTEGNDALGFTPGDASQLAAIIRQLAINPSLRLRLGTSARARAELRFDASRYGTQLLAIYHSLASPTPD